MTVQEARDVAVILSLVRIPDDPETRAKVAAAAYRLGLVAGEAIIAAVSRVAADRWVPTFAEAVGLVTELSDATARLNAAEGGGL